MPRSLLARSLEPLAAISWGVFLAWSLWLAVVWVLGINQGWLGLPIATPAGWQGEAAVFVQDTPPPPYADLRRAVLLLADNAELAWLALALIQLHLHVIGANGMNTARVWLGVAIGGAFLLAAVNRAHGVPFGWMQWTRVLGAQFFGVPLGWILLWPVLLVGSREAMLRFWRRASHWQLTTAAALLVLFTAWMLHPVARDARARAWWFFHNGNLHHEAPTPWWHWLAWFGAAWVLLALMRERTVAAAATARSWKPVIVLAVLNVAALATRLRL